MNAHSSLHFASISREELERVNKEIIGDEVALQGFRARYNTHEVISIKVDKALPKSESSSESGWGTKFKLIRRVGETTGAVRCIFKRPLVLSLQSVLPPNRLELGLNVELGEACEGRGALHPPCSRSFGSTLIESSDQALAYRLGEIDYTTLPFRSLFGVDGPKLSDIQQTDNRSTCSILSSAATYISSPVGVELFRQMFTEHDDDYVFVRLFSNLLDKDLNIRVNRSIIRGKGGESLFSMPATKKDYTVALEKALLSLNLSYKQIAEECIADCSSEYKGHWLRLLQGRTGDYGQVKLDYINPARILEHFPPVDIGAKRPFEKPESILLPLDSRTNNEGWEKTRRLLVYNGKRGVPMVFATHTGFKGMVSTLKTGTPTGHSVAFLRFAVDTKSGREGVLIFDPYGNSLGQGVTGLEDRIHDYTRECELVLSGKASPVQFVFLDEIPERFSEVTIAQGAEKNVPVEPIEASFCFPDLE